MKCQHLSKCLARLTPRHLQVFLIGVALTSLVIAYLADYKFGIKPCDFCLYERLVFISVIFVGALSFTKKSLFAGHRGIIAQLIILTIGLGLTFYHVGMEQHWWAGPASCTGISMAATLEDFRAQLMKATRPRCDQVSWALWGISMTLWSLILQAGLGFLTSLGLYSPDLEKKS